MPIGKAEYTELVTSTLEDMRRSDLVDQVFTQDKTLELVKEHATSGSGRSHVVNLIGATTGDTQWTDASGTFNTTVDGEIIGAAEYAWSQPLISHVRLKYRDLQMNQGSETQVFDLLETHISNAVRGHGEAISGELHATTYDPDRIVPFLFAIGDNTSDVAATTPSPALQFGGIDSATATFWNSQRTSFSATSIPSISDAFDEFLLDLEDANDGSEVTHILASREVYTEYKRELKGDIQYVFSGTGEQDAQGTVRDIAHGDVVIRYNKAVGANQALFLSMPTWRFKYLNDEFMRVQEAQKVPGTLDMVVPIASLLSVGVTSRRANGLFTRTA